MLQSTEYHQIHRQNSSWQVMILFTTISMDRIPVGTWLYLPSNPPRGLQLAWRIMFFNIRYTDSIQGGMVDYVTYHQIHRQDANWQMMLLTNRSMDRITSWQMMLLNIRPTDRFPVVRWWCLPLEPLKEL